MDSESAVGSASATDGATCRGAGRATDLA